MTLAPYSVDARHLEAFTQLTGKPFRVSGASPSSSPRSSGDQKGANVTNTVTAAGDAAAAAGGSGCGCGSGSGSAGNVSSSSPATTAATHSLIQLPALYLMSVTFKLAMALLVSPRFPFSILGTVVNKGAKYVYIVPDRVTAPSAVLVAVSVASLRPLGISDVIMARLGLAF